MTWTFDQAPHVACITSRSVLTGSPVLVVTRYEDDGSWAFMDAGPFDTANAMLVAMSTVLDRHPELMEIAELPPGWSATRNDANAPWLMEKDDFGSDQ